MSKIITSPVKRWPGTVTLADPLTFPQFRAWKTAIQAAHAYATANNGTAQQEDFDELIVPGLCACIEQCDLKGLGRQLSPENFPATPPGARAKLIGWLVSETRALMDEAEGDIPNA